MTASVRNVVFEAPDPQALAEFYAELLDLEFLRRPPDWTVIGREGEYPRLAFDPATDHRPPRWPDPAFPQQLHLDLTVSDRAGTETWLAGRGATRLPDLGGDCHVWADPAGHPFCLCEDPAAPRPRVDNVVLDSEDHAALAAFYAEVLGMRKVGHESDDWITIGPDGEGDGVRLGFAKVAEHRRPRWPDPAYPQQLHLDVQVDDQDASVELAVRLGGARLPEHGGDAPVVADPAGHPFCVCPKYQPLMMRWFDDAWGRWVSEIRAIDPAATRIPGVCGDWTLHDVVGHVQAYARFRLAHVRGAFSGRAPSRDEVDGAREPWPDGVENTLEARNAAIREAGLGLTWEQLLDEADWIRDETLRFLGGLGENLLEARVGWVNFWEPRFRADPANVDGLMIRRLRDLPAAENPVPAWQFVQPDEPDKHLSEHLEQIRGWLAARKR